MAEWEGVKCRHSARLDRAPKVSIPLPKSLVAAMPDDQREMLELAQQGRVDR